MALLPCQKVAAGYSETERERAEKETTRKIGVNMLLAGHAGEDESRRRTVPPAVGSK